MIRVSYDSYTGLYGSATADDGSEWTVHDSAGYLDSGPSCSECGACECGTVAECGCRCECLQIQFGSYSGLAYAVADCESLAEVRRAVSRFIRQRLATGHEVAYIGHNRWEVNEPEDCALVPDTAGLLSFDGSPNYFDGKACDYSAHVDGCNCEPECIGLSFAYVCLDGGESLCVDCAEREGVDVVKVED